MLSTIIAPKTIYKNSLKNILELYLKHDISKQGKTELVFKIFKTTYGETITKETIPKLVEIIDNTYFNGLIFKSVIQDKDTLIIDYSENHGREAGYCQKQGCEYTLFLNKKDIEGLFLKQQKHYIANGLNCHSKLECAISLVQHEMVHLVMQMTGLGSGHDKVFKKLSLNLYGHTEHFHHFDEEQEKKNAEMIIQNQIHREEANKKYAKMKEEYNVGDKFFFTKHDREYKILKINKISVIAEDSKGNQVSSKISRCSSAN